MNLRPHPDQFRQARQMGIEWVRLAPNKWLNGRPQSEAGDFLIGRPGRFSGIVRNDLRHLLEVLDWAEGARVKVVVTLLSLPGARWRQHNGGVEERRLWQDWGSQDTAVEFWVHLARALKDHPAVVGYNLRNEPSPERVAPRLADWHSGDYEAWYQKVKGTPADLNLFYAKAIKALRSVDPDTPIVLDSGFYGAPWAFKVLRPVEDDEVLYSFHMYEPYAFTNHRSTGEYRYPGEVPVGESENPTRLFWNQQTIREFLKPVSDWQRRSGVPSRRVLVGEFGVYRRNPGAARYLRDLIRIFNERKWHWAFYAFREDGWDGMDYELGADAVPGAYWVEAERGAVFPGLKFYQRNPMSDAIVEGLRSPATRGSRSPAKR